MTHDHDHAMIVEDPGFGLGRLLGVIHIVGRVARPGSVGTSRGFGVTGSATATRDGADTTTNVDRPSAASAAR